jgi:hypothetical protein
MLDRLELGSITILFRPRVNRDAIESIDDVQRLLLLLEPRGAKFARLIAIGRKRLPRAARRERFWGFVDLVRERRDITAALGTQTYLTKTHGARVLAAAEAAASGTYAIAAHADEHGQHTHLAFEVTPRGGWDIERSGNYIVTVANPDPAAWGLIEPPPLQEELFPEYEVHVALPALFPDAIQSRFEGKRYLAATPELLAFEGAELVFVAAAEDVALKDLVA